MAKITTFFNFNKSTSTNHIEFTPLPTQSLLKSSLKRFLDHPNNRYMEQKLYQKTTTNNFNTFQNLSQQIYLSYNHKSFKDTYREKAPSYKTAALTESQNKEIWVVGTSNQIFIRGS